MFGNPETTPGGMALKFHASQRIDLRKKGAVPANKASEQTGITVKAKASAWSAAWCWLPCSVGVRV